MEPETDTSTEPTGCQPVVTITGLDHFVLRVADAEASLAFYCGTLGLAGDRVEGWRAGEVPFPSVRIDATTIIDLFPTAEGEPPNPEQGTLDHLCVTIEPTDLDALAASGRVTVVRGPQERLFGAQGYATSLYVADPDGITVELRSY